MQQVFCSHGVQSGSLIAVRDPDSQEIVTLSLPAFGHAIIGKKAEVIGKDGNPIKPASACIRRRNSSKPEFAEVIDPGDQYHVAFDPHAPYGHLAMVDKA